MDRRILEVDQITKKFGGIVAINDCSFSVSKGEILGVIGPNGSGKSTLFNVINGIYKPEQGKILYKDQDISKMKPHKLAHKGMGRIFQISQPFQSMSVMDNMLTVFFNRKKASELLNFFEISALKDESAGSLSGGQQRLLEMARVMMLEPELILMDEPLAGINPVLIEKLKQFMKEINSKGITLIVVEHEVPFIMDLCNSIVVLEFGEKIAEGSPDAIQKNKRVIEAYLGGSNE